MRISDWSSDVCSSDLVIAGGGPAGTAAALTLARAGQSPLVIERGEAADAKLCGCFLSSETEAMLARLGVQADRPRASTIDRVRLVAAHRSAAVRLGSEERRVGKEGVSTGRSRWWRTH